MSFSRVEPRLAARDLAASMDFYTRRLGFECVSSWPEENPAFAILRRDGVGLQLSAEDSTSAGAAAGGGSTVWFDVDDVRALHERLRADDVEIEWGPEVYGYGRRELGLRDPAGNLVILSESTDDPVTDEG